MKDNEEYPKIELFVRSLTPDGVEEQQEKVIKRLEELADEGKIGRFETQVWGKQICVTDGGKETRGIDLPAIEKYEEFVEWGAEEGVSLAPFFQERESIRGDVVVFPVMCVAIYDENDLKGVYPHMKFGENEAYSVNDALELLKEKEEELLLA